MSRHLTAVHIRPSHPTGTIAPAAPAAPAARADDRTDLDRLACGEPVLLEQLDLIAFANSDWAELDPNRAPDTYTLAEVTLSWFHRHVGANRRTKGDRSVALAGTLHRYLLPYALELGHPTGHRCASSFRLAHAEQFVDILAGSTLLPAATVAGDLLDRVGAACVWLSLLDAARVSRGSEQALDAALRTGRLPLHLTHDGRHVIAAADLRDAGLLIERETPHGLAMGTAANHWRTLRDCLNRASDLGVPLTGSFTNVCTRDPLPVHRQRPETEPLNEAITVAMVAAVCAFLSPTMQLVLWLLRLTGMRIGEAYGLLVSDYTTDDRGGWLRIQTQGGSDCLVRDEHGRLRLSHTKDHTKTAQSQRTIPIPPVLGRLIDEVIAVYHTDPATGHIDTDARLVPGLAGENTGGIAALRSALNKAIGAVLGRDVTLPKFTPHDLRASLITDLYSAASGISERLAEWYTGHTFATTVHRGYDLGPPREDLLPVAAVFQTNVDVCGLVDLRMPTATCEQFGRSTRRGRQAAALRAQLAEAGWLLPRGTRPPLWPERPTAQHSADVGSPGDAVGFAHRDVVPAGADPLGSGALLLDGARQLDGAQVAQRARVTPVTARRWMREGAIPAHQERWGGRLVWLAAVADVEVFLARRDAGVTLGELADETGWSYHQLFRLLSTLQVTATGRMGRAIRLAAPQADAIRAEVARRAAAADMAVPVAEAADRLGLPVLTVETLLRQGELELGPTPDATRHRYVTEASIDSYLAGYPLPRGESDRPDDGAGERVVPQSVARQALGLTRPQLTFLVTSRHLVARTRRRRMYITLDSIEQYAGTRSDLADALAHCRAKSRAA